MRKYILTEQQLNRALNAKVTKGIGLKIRDNDGEYYKSIVKTFDTDKEFKDWENNLKEGTTIIGVIDIDEPQPDMIKEEENKSTNKLKNRGIQMLERLIIKKYPYITGLRLVETTENQAEHQYVKVDLDVDLNKFYMLTGTRPPDIVIDLKLWGLLDANGVFLMRYVNSSNSDKVNKLKDRIEEDLNILYKQLPPKYVNTLYQGMTDDEIDQLPTTYSSPYAKKWRDEFKPMNVFINYFIPHYNVDKLIQTFIPEQ